MATRREVEELQRQLSSALTVDINGYEVTISKLKLQELVEADLKGDK